jgi:hypothetical protein
MTNLIYSYPHSRPIAMLPTHSPFPVATSSPASTSFPLASHLGSTPARSSRITRPVSSLKNKGQLSLVSFKTFFQKQCESKERVNTAARRIQSLFKQLTWTKKLLKDPNIYTLKTSKKRSWLRFCSKKLEAKLKKHRLARKTKMHVMSFLKSHFSYTSDEIPIIQSLYPLTCTEKSFRKINATEYTRINGYYLDPQIQSCEKSKAAEPITKKEIDSWVQILASQKEIPWNYTVDGCYGRLGISCQILELLGVPKNRIFKQYVYGYNNLSSQYQGKKIKWDYHVALGIVADNGTRWIIDPSSNPDKALAINDWVRLYYRGPYKRFSREFTKTGDVAYKPDEVFLMHLPFHLYANPYTQTKGLTAVSKHTEKRAEVELKKLAEFREKLELTEFFTHCPKLLALINLHLKITEHKV